MKLRKLGSLAVCAAATLAVAACSGGSTSAAGGDSSETVLTVSTIGSVADAALQLGIDRGIFAEEGLKIETIPLTNPPAAVAAAQSGEVDVAFVPVVPFINAVSQGVPLTAVAGADELPAKDTAKFDDGAIVVNPDSGIDSFADLAGKKIAIPARKGVYEVVTTAALVKAGVDPASVEWLSLDFAAALEAVKSGSIDAASLSSPFNAQALGDGMKILGKPTAEAFGEGPVDIYASGQQAVAEKAEALEKFRTAMHKANAYANEHVDDALATGVKMAGFDIKPSEVTPVYWSTELKPETLDEVAATMTDLGFLKEKPDFSKAIMK
ncbi:ABC transporter substrate-binding protein [Arthrobacter sp. GCM10027362]|uniref:ABC transporter substrate-binding protein n=1 Tax=Arthrobacter sp. GCM10027362 TaxID=3273379 RepID=UPI003642DB77